MTIRRLPFLALLLALMLAPLGRMGMAEATAAHHAPEMAMAGHCADMPASPPAKSDKAAADCAIACAAVASVEIAALAPIAPARTVPQALPLPAFAGINLGADPPPPRVS